MKHPDAADNLLADGTMIVYGGGYFVIVAGNKDREGLYYINKGCNEVFKTLGTLDIAGREYSTCTKKNIILMM